MAGIRHNLIGSIYLSLASSGGQILLVPLFLHCWGAHDFGSWLVLFTIPAFFVFSDAGLSNTVGNAVTLSLQQGRPAEAEARLNAAWKFQAIAWGIVFGVFCLLLALFPVQKWLAIGEMPTRDFVTATLLLCLYSLASLQTGVLAAIYRGASRYSSYLMWSAHARVLETGLAVFALVAGGRFIAVASAMLAGRVLGALVLYSGGRNLLPDVRLSFFAGRWCDLTPLLPSGLAFLSFPAANAVINQGTILVINQLLGPTAVVQLSVCRQIARVFQQGTQIVLTAFQPEITSAYGVEDWKRVSELQTSALILPLLIAAPFVVGATLGGPFVIEWWTQKDIGVTWPLLLACSLEAVAFGCGALCCLIPWSINRVRALSVVYAAANIAALVLTGCLLTRVGAVAAPLAFFFAGLAYCLTGLRLGVIMGHFSFRAIFTRHAFLSAMVRWRIGGVAPG